MTIILILSYILHILICRWLYMKIIKKDPSMDVPMISITWWIFGIGLASHLFVLFIQFIAPKIVNAYLLILNKIKTKN